MSCNPCCCNLKDSAVTIGIWSVVYSMASLALFSWQIYVLNNCQSVVMAQANLQCEWDCPCVGASTARTTAIIEEPRAYETVQVFSVAQLGIMGWQMAAIKYEKDRAANTLLPNYNTYGKYDIPSYYESYWQSPEERYYIGLFIIQVLCLISVFFLLFASAAMIWGVHTWSKYLIWPWFPCMVCSILTSLAYCIMWWAGDVRDYWLAITIIEIIGVFINIYCVVVVMMYYRRIEAVTSEFEGKSRGRRGSKRSYRGRTDLLTNDGGDFPRHDPRKSPFPMRTPYPPSIQQNFAPMHQPYPSPYSPAGVPQTPLPLPPSYTPYPRDPNEVINYQREPKKQEPIESGDEDPVTKWVKTQQKMERGEASSEPISPTRDDRRAGGGYPIQHSRSVPSLVGKGSLVSHKDCDHGRKRDHHHRSSSRRKRSKSRRRERSSSTDSATRTDFDRNHRSSSRRKHRSRSRYSESEFTATTDHHRHRDREREKEHRHHRDDESRKSHRRRSREHRRDDDRGSRRRHRERREEDERLAPAETMQENQYPLSGGLVVPQHIVIPPSTGERGPDGQPLPQKFQINSEITINYDQNATQHSSGGGSLQEPYSRRIPVQPMQITSNV